MDGDGRVDGAVEGRWMLSRTKHGGLMLLHASRKNVIVRVEMSGAAYMTVLGVQNVCNVCRRQPKSLQKRRGGCMPEPQCFKFHGWNEGLLEAMLQSCYDRFEGLSKLTKGWTGVYMADGAGRWCHWCHHRCHHVPPAMIPNAADVQVTSHGEHWLQRDVAVAFKHAEIPWLDTGEWRVKCVSAPAVM